MDRNPIIFSLRAVVPILIATLVLSTNGEAQAGKVKQKAPKAAVKTRSSRSAVKRLPQKKSQARKTSKDSAKSTDKLFARRIEPSFVDNSVELVNDYEEDFDDRDSFSCGSEIDCNQRKISARVYGGFEATYIQPRYEQNVAFTTMTGNNNGSQSFTDTEFNYDLEFSPRVWLGIDFSDGLGWRVTWWQFDHAPTTVSANPPANGFGAISHPAFGNVDISSGIPTDSFSAASSLNAYTIDLETLKRANLGSWDLAIGGGVRYARIKQGYLAQLRDSTNALRGQIDYRQSIEGVGPTLSLAAYRSLSSNTGFFCNARGSILFGNGGSTLTAGEDLDLTTPLSTTRTTGRNDLLSIGDLQVGFRWQSQNGRLHRPFLSLALEGQIWNGAGSATSEDGTLGFLGIISGFGIDW